MISFNLLMTWIYLRVPDSLVPMFLAHFTFNFFLMLAGPKGLGLGATMPLFTWLAGFTLVTAIALWVLHAKHYSQSSSSNHAPLRLAL